MDAPQRKPYPTDVSDEEWHCVLPYLTLMRADAPQRHHDLREVFNALRWLVRTGAQWDYLPHEFPACTLQSTPMSGERAGYDGAKRRKGGKIHIAVDTLGHLLALRVTPADAQDRAQVAALLSAVQEVTDNRVEVA